jgi:hypothetical protein
MGTNPGEVREGPRKGLRVLGVEEELARTLVKSLNDDQKKTAIYTNTAPSEIITAAERKVHNLDPKGVPASKLTTEQKDMLFGVIKEYVNRSRPEIADRELNEIRNSGEFYFAWAGSVERGQPHYYRVQGPTFLIEYDNTQNNANHVHAVMRNLDNDFGDDVLKRHYDESHK